MTLTSSNVDGRKWAQSSRQTKSAVVVHRSPSDSRPASTAMRVGKVAAPEAPVARGGVKK
jgi:hypothetical protein